MNKVARTLIAGNAGILCLLLGSAFATDPAHAADLVVNGSYHTSMIMNTPKFKFTDYNEDTTDVKVSYTITTKIDPASGMKVFDTSDTNSFVIFTNKFGGKDFTTAKVPITDIRGNPATGEVISFEFAGTAWDPARPPVGAPGAGAVNSAGISGVVDVEGKTATLKSMYTQVSGASASYTFETQDKKPGGPKADPKSGMPIMTSSSIPPGNSINFDATTGLLSIIGDKIVGTPDPSDPILGANVNLSDYQFTGFTTDGALAIFWPTGGEGLTSITKGASTFEQADLSVLFYDVANNLFYGSPLNLSLAGMPTGSPFYDPSLATFSSSYLNSIEDVLDPFSPDFDPNAYLFLTVSPDTNLDTATAGFTASGTSGGVDSLFVADVPEPSSLALLIAGLAGLCLFGRGRTPLRGRG